MQKITTSLAFDDQPEEASREVVAVLATGPASYSIVAALIDRLVHHATMITLETSGRGRTLSASCLRQLMTHRGYETGTPRRRCH